MQELGIQWREHVKEEYQGANIHSHGTFGFDEFRKDVEDVGGWLPLHRYSNQVFETLQQAEQTAKTAVPWLSRMTRIITVYEQKPKVM